MPQPTEPSPSSWLAPGRHDPHALRRGRRWLLLALVAFAAVTWFALPHGIGFSWRECDTQAIARNFVLDGFDPLRPRIDWRGATDGAVECEFPLYQLAIASVLTFTGEGAEWPGRLLAMLATMFAAVSLHRLLELRAGAGGALAGVLTFLVSGSAMMIGTRVMPDAWSFALAAASLPAFARYLHGGRRLSLWLSMAALAFAALQKPLALQLGIVMFGWTALLARHRLRDPQLWLGWVAVLAVVAAWLLHGKSLHEETGLTFGVISGGDSKFPALEHLLSPKIHAQLAWTTVQYGLSGLGVVGALWLLLNRRMDRSDVVLLGAVALGLYVSLRYSYHQVMGPHYHTFAALAGAWCVARAWPAKANALLWGALLVAVMAQGYWRWHVEHEARTGAIDNPFVDLAASIRRLSLDGDRIVVRSSKELVDKSWKRRNNYEDPRLFYNTGLHGWVVPIDGFDVAALEGLKRDGATLVCDPEPGLNAPEVTAWLDANAERVIDEPWVHVHRLR